MTAEGFDPIQLLTLVDGAPTHAQGPFTRVPVCSAGYRPVDICPGNYRWSVVICPGGYICPGGIFPKINKKVALQSGQI